MVGGREGGVGGWTDDGVMGGWMEKSSMFWSRFGSDGVVQAGVGPPHHPAVFGLSFFPTQSLYCI